MSDNQRPLDDLHLRTIEGFIAKIYEAHMYTNESIRDTNKAMTELSKSVNELVIAEKLRTETDLRIKSDIKEIKEVQKQYSSDWQWLSKMHKNWDNYVGKILMPLIITGIIIAIASTGGFAIFAGGK